MRNALWSSLALAALFGTWACAGTPGPGEAGYPYNLSGSYGGEIFVEGMAFAFQMDVRTDPAGRLEGSYAVTSPVSMSGAVEGTIVADTARFSLEYLNPMDGCGGTLNGTGTVESGGGAFAGRVRVNDACNGYLAGTFSTKRR